MMERLGQEVSPEKIRANSICPGAIKTPINKSAWNSKEALEMLMDIIPYKRGLEMWVILPIQLFG